MINLRFRLFFVQNVGLAFVEVFWCVDAFRALHHGQSCMWTLNHHEVLEFQILCLIEKVTARFTFNFVISFVQNVYQTHVKFLLFILCCQNTIFDPWIVRFLASFRRNTLNRQFYVLNTFDSFLMSLEATFSYSRNCGFVISKAWTVPVFCRFVE